MRGKLYRAWGERVQGRNTPRVCGENQLQVDHKRVAGRNTPAYAGKTRCGCHSFRALWEHPRVCGENPIGEITYRDIQGTPPRMRGKLLMREWRSLGVGNTPAYAGKTLHDQHVYRAEPNFSVTSSDNKTGFTAWILPAPKGGASALQFGEECPQVGGSHHCCGSFLCRS